MLRTKAQDHRVGWWLSVCILHQPPNRTETMLMCSLGDVPLFLGLSTREKQRQGVPSTADRANTSAGTTLQTTARERSCVALCTRTPSKNGYHSAYFTRYSTTPARYRQIKKKKGCAKIRKNKHWLWARTERNTRAPSPAYEHIDNYAWLRL